MHENRCYHPERNDAWSINGVHCHCPPLFRSFMLFRRCRQRVRSRGPIGSFAEVHSQNGSDTYLMLILLRTHSALRFPIVVYRNIPHNPHSTFDNDMREI